MSLIHVSVCTHSEAEYQKVDQALEWDACFVKASCTHSIHWELVAGRSTGDETERQICGI